MCTVSFLPARTGGGYLLATNRDERPDRASADPPAILAAEGPPVIAPRDPDGGGTWVVADTAGRTLCVLNGPEGSRPDAPSRGLLVAGLAREMEPARVAERLRDRAHRGELRENPFRLLLAVPGSGRYGAALQRFDWDGQDLRVHDARCGPALTVSSQWRRDEVTTRRQGAFAGLVGRLSEQPQARVEQLLAWHASHEPGAPQGDGFSVCMHRPDARTVSCTLVAVQAGSVTVRYRPGWPCGGAALQTCTFPRTR